MYDYREYLKYDFLDWAQFLVALLVTKISVCLFLLRLSQFNRVRVVLYALIGFLVMTHIPLFLLFVLQCNPVSKEWDSELPGQCLSKDTVKNIVLSQGGKHCEAHRSRMSLESLTILISLFTSDRFHWCNVPSHPPAKCENQVWNQAWRVSSHERWCHVSLP